MAKGRSPSELITRVVRVNVGDYLLLTEISRKLGKTMAEALHLVITNRAKQDSVTVTPQTQIPMLLGTTAYRATPITAIRAIPITAIATNGDKAVVFRIKSKGVRRE